MKVNESKHSIKGSHRKKERTTKKTIPKQFKNGKKVPAYQ